MTEHSDYHKGSPFMELLTDHKTRACLDIFATKRHAVLTVSDVAELSELPESVVKNTLLELEQRNLLINKADDSAFALSSSDAAEAFVEFHTSLFDTPSP